MPKFGVIVGNGLNLDLRANYPVQLAEWNTTNPLRWKAAGARIIVDSEDILAPDDNRRDYEIIESALMPGRFMRETEHGVRVHICNMLLRAFAAYHRTMAAMNLEKWAILKWLRTHPEDLAYVVSLNYDLVFEVLMEMAGIPYRRIGVRDESSGVPIFKPHGSLDFGLPDFVVQEGEDFSKAYRTDLWELQCNYYEALPPERLGEERASCDIVLPTDYNRIQHYHTIDDGYREIAELTQEITHLVALGISYWTCDRPELDKLVDHAPSHACIIMVNPYPSPDWMKKIQEGGRALEHWPRIE